MPMRWIDGKSIVSMAFLDRTNRFINSLCLYAHVSVCDQGNSEKRQKYIERERGKRRRGGVRERGGSDCGRVLISNKKLKSHKTLRKIAQFYSNILVSLRTKCWCLSILSTQPYHKLGHKNEHNEYNNIFI